MSEPKELRIPKRALERIHLGQSFAEYDSTLTDPSVFVHTPALNAASSFGNPHCFFVGRRGTGKTTITRYIEDTVSATTVIRPELFSPSASGFQLDQFRDAKQRPFRSLTAAFRRSLQDEVLFLWAEQNPGQLRRLPTLLSEELQRFREKDFDLRSLAFIDEVSAPLVAGDDPTWLTAIKLPKLLGEAIVTAGIGGTKPISVLLDAIDESWDGSELAVTYLAALMHACLEVNSQLHNVRALMFIRENIFERVRVIDTEFARLETCVVGLDWSEEQLLEMVERRINAPLTTKFPLGGATWNLFFEQGPEARRQVFEICQSRPRDVLTYTALALDTAQSHKHEVIMIEDLQDARRRFSDSRFKDLGDEYQENYPNIELILARFYGLGRRWTVTGLEQLLQRLLGEEDIERGCGKWIYDHATPELFVRLLYNIGFIGLELRRRGEAVGFSYRSFGPRDTTPPAITAATDVQIHPTYWEALELQDVLVREFADTEPFRRAGLLTELPGAMSLGEEESSKFEDAVGDVLKLCFFRVLANVEEQVREVDNTIRRDWVASNRAPSGFWEVVRQRYKATQVIFECKNYEKLQASDFHQASYYSTAAAGRFVVVVFRGEIEKHYFQHVKRIHQNDTFVLLLNNRDLQVFIRQALNGKPKEEHLLDRYDKTVRAIS